MSIHTLAWVILVLIPILEIGGSVFHWTYYRQPEIDYEKPGVYFNLAVEFFVFWLCLSIIF